MSYSSSAVMLQQSGTVELLKTDFIFFLVYAFLCQTMRLKTAHIYAPLRKVQEPKLLRIKKRWRSAQLIYIGKGE